MLPTPSTFLFPALAALLPLARAQPPYTNPPLPNPNTYCSVAAVGSAVYLMTNEDVNSIIALPIAADGRISLGTITATMGAGGVGLGADGKPVGGDALFSQSSLVVAENLLFAVNAGSNSLSMFVIDDANPTSLRLLGNPATVPGDFPTTVAVSLRHRLACVGTAGKRSGVACATFSRSTGLGAFGGLADFRPIRQQSTPPVGPPNTVSHAFFADDESGLIVTIKGDPADSNSHGRMVKYDIEGASCYKTTAGVRYPARISGTPTSVYNTKLLFGAIPLKDVPYNSTGKGRVLVTDPTFGAAIVVPQPPSLGYKVETKFNLYNQKATCWAAVSPASGVVYLTDGAVPQLSVVLPDEARVYSYVDLSSTGVGGFLDIVGAGDYMYLLSAGADKASVTVVDVGAGKGSAKLHQHLSLGSLAGRRAMGMGALLQ